MADAPASDAPLSVDQALGLLDAPAAAVELEEAVPGTEQPLEAEPTAEVELEPEEAIETEPEEEGDPADPVIAAPQSWDAEARAVFATLPREAQQVIAARETARDTAVSKAQQEAAETRKRAETDTASVTQLRAATEQVLNVAAQTFKGKWDNVDWATWAQSDPAAYVAGKAQFEAEQGKLAQLQAVHQQQSATEQRAFQATKADRIKTEAPDLVDPTHGPARVQKLEKFLVDNGIPQAVFPTLDAFTIGLAYDGMRYRAAKATAPTKSPVPARAAVRPAATQQVRTPQRVAQESQNRFSQTRSVEDAVAMLNSRK